MCHLPLAVVPSSGVQGAVLRQRAAARRGWVLCAPPLSTTHLDGYHLRARALSSPHRRRTVVVFAPRSPPPLFLYHLRAPSLHLRALLGIGLGALSPSPSSSPSRGDCPVKCEPHPSTHLPWTGAAGCRRGEPPPPALSGTHRLNRWAVGTGRRGGAVGTATARRGAGVGTATGRRVVAAAIGKAPRSGAATAAGTPPRRTTRRPCTAHRGARQTGRACRRSAKGGAIGSRRPHPPRTADGEELHQYFSSSGAATRQPNSRLIYPSPLHTSRPLPRTSHPAHLPARAHPAHTHQDRHAHQRQRHRHPPSW